MESDRAWRCIVSEGDEAASTPGAACGARNMAVDEALFESVRAGGVPVLRLYRWDPPCLSLGRNQVARGTFDADRARALGIGIVRRPTGGLAVLHDRELTYAVAVPTRLLRGPRATFLALHRALLAGILRLGAPAMLAPDARAPVAANGNGSHPCFAQRARGEIVAHGRKLVGSAQRARRDALLQHGSILIDGDQARVRSLQRPARVAADGAITLAELLGRIPGADEVAAAIRAGFTGSLGIRLCDSVLDPRERARADALEMRYRNDHWTWRR